MPLFSCCCTASAMPVGFRCLKRVSVCWVMGRILFEWKLWGPRMFLVLLRQFWITERTCGQLVAATGRADRL